MREVRCHVEDCVNNGSEFPGECDLELIIISGRGSCDGYEKKKKED